LEDINIQEGMPECSGGMNILRYRKDLIALRVRGTYSLDTTGTRGRVVRK
jgi:hypothetical protein